MTKQFNIPPQSFDEMPYWEFEIYLKLLNNAVKEENESQKAEMDKYHISKDMIGKKSKLYEYL